MLVHEICDLGGMKFPDRIAITDDEGATWTFGEFAKNAEAIATWLSLKGVRKGDIVSFLARNLIEGYALLIASSKIGAIFAPLNYRLPPVELRQVLLGYRPKVILYDHEYAASAEELQTDATLSDIATWHSLRSDRESRGLLSIALQLPPRAYHPVLAESDTCWICSTSGSTGQAKGVMLSHSNTIAGMINYLINAQVSESDVYLRAGAIFHIGLFTPLAYWLAGARVVITNFEARRSLDLIANEGVTHLIAPGTILKLLVERQEAQPSALKLRLVVGGGAPLSASLARRAVVALKCKIAQIYGLTEICLMGTFLAPDEYESGLNSVPESRDAKRLESGGRASPTCAVSIIDDDWRALPAYEIGEVAFSGPSVMQGYWGMPDLTGKTLQRRWLRTGDIGYLDEDGYVFLLDRKKDMIISGAENVFSVQVETVIAAHPGISEVAVIGIPDPHWGELVTAIVVKRENAVVDQQAIIEFCRGQLAGYKIPKRVDFRLDLPRGSGGRKVDKAALKKDFWGNATRLIQGI